MHENVPNFPGAYIEEPFAAAGYNVEKAVISPQRFGKPMNRPG